MAQRLSEIVAERRARGETAPAVDTSHIVDQRLIRNGTINADALCRAMIDNAAVFTNHALNRGPSVTGRGGRAFWGWAGDNSGEVAARMAILTARQAVLDSLLAQVQMVRPGFVCFDVEDPPE